MYGCSDKCIYTLKGDKNKKFCFKPGNLDSVCVEQNNTTVEGWHDFICTDVCEKYMFSV